MRKHINGDQDETGFHFPAAKYRSGRQLVSLFVEYGLDDVYGEGFPSRWEYTETSLRRINDSFELPNLICTIFDRLEYQCDDEDYDAVIEDINRYLERDGFRIEAPNGKVSVLATGSSNVAFAVPKHLEIASGEYILDHVEKCKSKLAAGDYSGAITNARSLCEDVLYEIEKKLDAQAGSYDGDLPKLFKRVKSLLGMDAGQGKGNDSIVQLLRGLTTIVNGLSGLSNVFADRHGGENEKSYRHHAELAVNTSNTLCSYVLASYQKQHT